MKSRNIFFGALAAAAFMIAAYCPKPAPAANKEAVLMQTLVAGLGQLHFSPPNLDDEFSKKVYKVYLNHLDFGRRFLTQPDVDKLKTYETKLDDQINTGSTDFFDLSLSLYDAGVAKAEKLFTQSTTEPIDFSVKEDVELDGDKKPFAKDDAELKDMWRKTLKYEVLSRLTSKLEEKESGKAAVKDKTETMLEQDALKEATKNYMDYFKRLKKVKRSERFSVFLNAVTAVYDPHTEYFEPIDKQNFDLSMSGRLIGIGARLQSDPDGDYTKVTDVMIGGPAWKQKELKEGDLIVKVAQGDKEPVSVAGMEINDVVSMIRGKEGTEVRLTVKAKADGSVKVISIIREEVIIEETYAKSLILQENPSADKIGYIHLPKFYADFEKSEGRQSAEDVEVELEKLKRAGVKGIILDLRNNGGGSLRDVQKMAGFFIEKGPIVQVKGKDAKPEVLNDEDDSVQYTGPLVIMQNEFSASASEIMTAAMQDYGRAIIVGSNSYGKGTVQRFFNLDRAIRGNDDVKPLGDVKVSIQKFFRVNGGSTQLRGVKPDIFLPDNYTDIKVGEESNDYPMPWTQISPVKFSQSVADLKNVPAIAQRSAERVKKSEYFKLVAENAKMIKIRRDHSEFPLRLVDYRAYEQKQKDFTKKFDALHEPITGFTATNITEDFQNIHRDSTKIKTNDSWLKEAVKDQHLYETVEIMKDLIATSTHATAAAAPKK